MKKSECTYDYFLQIVGVTQPMTTDIRAGQHYFNVLHIIRPDIAEKVRGTKMDPFYKDSVPVETQNFVASAWGDVQ